MSTVTITEGMRQKLLEAARSATHHGGCVYLAGGRPACVVAQLAALEGVSTGQLTGWSGHMVRTVLDRRLDGGERLAPYGADLLERLQRIWDGGALENRDAEGARGSMLAAVEAACQ